ncbi:hypothetical protein GCM10010214_12600 [Streptomyces abikoensis]|nr:hypothetical protein GCM10010214_12600 [Streptomyces abikoensis]
MWPSASVTVFRSTVSGVMTRQVLPDLVYCGPAAGFFPDTGRAPAAAVFSGPAAGRDAGAAEGLGPGGNPVADAVPPHTRTARAAPTARCRSVDKVRMRLNDPPLEGTYVRHKPTMRTSRVIDARSPFACVAFAWSRS